MKEISRVRTQCVESMFDIIAFSRGLRIFS